MRHGLAVAALLCAFATGCGGHGRDPGTIVFQSDRSGRQALYAARPDGSDVTKLINGADASWTRDGTKVLLDYGSASFVFEPASRARRNVRLPESVVEPPQLGRPWSPDGKRLAFVSNEGDVVVLDVETGVRRRLKGNWSVNDLVHWSPDGERVLFASGKSFYTVAAKDGGPPTRLLRLARHEPAFPQWSSDGRWILFFDFGGSQTRLYVVRSDGTRLHLIAHDAQWAAWSPTGERLAFPSHTGIVLVDVEHGRRRQLTERPIEVPFDQGLAWSPDGERILYARNDLVYAGPGSGYHTQLWTMKADGTEQHPVTHAFPGDGENGPAAWVAGTVRGTPAATLPLVSLRGARTIATRLPIAALAAEGNRAAVSQGFGGPRGFRGPLGPIVVWRPFQKNTVRIPVPGCGSTPDVMLAAGGVGYRCENASVAYTVDDTLRLARPGKRSTTEIVHTHGEEFSGSLLGGLAADGEAIDFDVGFAAPVQGEFRIGLSRIWKVTGARRAIVRTFRGEATVASVDAGRIAVLRAGKAVSVLFPGGGTRTFAFGRRRILGAALDGPRLIAIDSGQLTAFDLKTRRRTAAWPVLPGFGPPPVLEDAQEDLVAYVVGVAIHILRLSDGREIVVQMPNATGPVFARFVPSGLFYSFNEAYDTRPGRLVFVTRSELERALPSTAPAP